jgi:anti-sigma factor RsiW
MKCRHAKKMISGYVDDALSPSEKKGFDLHLRSCASCKEALEEIRALHRLFASAQRFPAPYGFSTRVLANLDEREALRARGFFGFRPFFLPAAQVALAVVVMAIGILSGSLLLPERTSPTLQTAVRQTFSLDLFQATPPDSIGWIYNTLMRPSHER